MKIKYTFSLFALLFFGSMILFFATNPSYEKSLRAKYYYEMGEYKSALELAKEAFSIDVYNRMASTIMAQSITSLKYTAYIEDAHKYMREIDEIATHEYIVDSDKAKIRTICHIMLSVYVKLAPSVVTDDELVQKAARYNKKFEQLLEKVD